jgi:hypothetical protein
VIWRLWFVSVVLAILVQSNSARSLRQTSEALIHQNPWWSSSIIQPSDIPWDPHILYIRYQPLFQWLMIGWVYLGCCWWPPISSDRGHPSPMSESLRGLASGNLLQSGSRCRMQITRCRIGVFFLFGVAFRRSEPGNSKISLEDLFVVDMQIQHYLIVSFLMQRTASAHARPGQSFVVSKQSPREPRCQRESIIGSLK